MTSPSVTPEQRIVDLSIALAEARAMVGRALRGPLDESEMVAWCAWLDEHPFDLTAALAALRAPMEAPDAVE